MVLCLLIKENMTKNGLNNKEVLSLGNSRASAVFWTLLLPPPTASLGRPVWASG